MKTLIKSLGIILLCVGLANCGSDDSSPAPAGPAANELTADISNIGYQNGGINVGYDQLKNNTDFFILHSSGYRECLKNSADDDATANVYAQIMAYLATASVGKGDKATVGANARYLVINYKNGQKRTFNLNNDSATTEEEILSNGPEIAAYLDSLHAEINQRNNGKCYSDK